jgi:hypothetical protein
MVRPPLVTALVTGIGGRGGLDAAFAATGPWAGAVVLAGSSVCLDFDSVVIFFGSRPIGQNRDHGRRPVVFCWIVTCLYLHVRYHVRDERVNDRRYVSSHIALLPRGKRRHDDTLLLQGREACKP